MKAKSIILSTVLLLVSLVFIDVGLRLLTPFPIHAFKANQVDDDILLYRLDQSLGGIDSNGFRNVSTADKVDIVAIGDSHTYGVNVVSEESWPSRLAVMTNLTAYNYGVSGYGILQYEHLINEAIKMDPGYVIVGIYPSNDLKVCKLIGRLDYWKDWADSRGYDTSLCPGKKKKTKKQRAWSGNFDPLEFLMHETAIGSLALYVWDLASLRFSPEIEERAVVINHDSNPTMTTRKRLTKHSKFMDLTRPEIRLGFDITGDVLVEAKRRLDEQDIKLIVMFVPSKESIYSDFLENSGEPVPQEYRDLVARERDIVDKLSSILDSHNIEHVDAAPYVSDALNRSDKVYAFTGDGHPLRDGYEAYAKAVYENNFAPR
jgi:lysophospholipase L1-like esterase